MRYIQLEPEGYSYGYDGLEIVICFEILRS